MTTPTERSNLAYRELESLQTGDMLSAMLDGQGAALAEGLRLLPLLTPLLLNAPLVLGRVHVDEQLVARAVRALGGGREQEV